MTKRRRVRFDSDAAASGSHPASHDEGTKMDTTKTGMLPPINREHAAAMFGAMEDRDSAIILLPNGNVLRVTGTDTSEHHRIEQLRLARAIEAKLTDGSLFGES